MSTADVPEDSFGGRVRRLRGAGRQKPIADYVGVDVRTYQLWEADNGIEPENLEKLAEYHGTTPRYLLYGETSERDDDPRLVAIDAKLDALIELLGGDELREVLRREVPRPSGEPQDRRDKTGGRTPPPPGGDPAP